MKTIIRSAKGKSRREINIDDIKVPDLWHIAMYMKKNGLEKDAEEILDTWGLAHDLLKNIKADELGEKL